MAKTPLEDFDFLKQLDREKIRTYYCKVTGLTDKEVRTEEIEGKVISGSISITGSSNTRRAGSMTIIADNNYSDILDRENIFALGRKIKIEIGLKNPDINTLYPSSICPIIWFPQGIFLVTNASITHSTSGISINISFKDKMCLLDGSLGGNLPTSVVFDTYDQVIGYGGYFVTLDAMPDSIFNNPDRAKVYQCGDAYYMFSDEEGWEEIGTSKNQEQKAEGCSSIGETMSIKNPIRDIIMTLVANFGNEDISRIIIQDVPYRIRNTVRNGGTKTLILEKNGNLKFVKKSDTSSDFSQYDYNEDCGYIYTDYTYPGELTSSIGENVCSILDKIKTTLGDYEYFYDLDGNFVFREKQIYENVVFKPLVIDDNNGFKLKEPDYYLSLNTILKSEYDFGNDGYLITNISNNIDYSTVKNDFHIWGKSFNDSGLALHYHLVIKDKPKVRTEPVDLYYNADTNWVRLAKDSDRPATGEAISGKYSFTIPKDDEDSWRVELFIQGLEAEERQERPDVYQQELMDLFSLIYEFKPATYTGNSTPKLEGKYKDDVKKPNDLTYWIDYIETNNDNEIAKISVDTIGTKIYSYQQDKIRKIYNSNVPNFTYFCNNITKGRVGKFTESTSYPAAAIDNDVYNVLAIGSLGYSAQEVARDLLYQYTCTHNTISLSTLPIYYLDVNKLITVEDEKTGIKGDYIVNSIALPLDGKSTMNISASKAVERNQ